MNEVDAKNLDRLFDALSSVHRREIINALSLQPHSIGQLASMRQLSLPAIHKHIEILESAHLIYRKKIGRTNILTLNRDALREVQDWLMQFHAYWGTSTESLENYTLSVEKSDTERG